jgi:urease accessory protein
MGMVARIRTTMDTRPMTTRIDPGLLTLAQWMSPAFPTGSFAFSHGIETAVSKGWVRDAGSLQAWLEDCLTEGSAHSDAIWLRLAHDAVDPREVDAIARTYAVSRERLREAERQGAAFTVTVNAVWDFELPDMLMPVAVGAASARAGLDQDATLGLYLHTFVANLVSAAMRLAPIGQTSGQAIILHLHGLCVEIVERSRGKTEEDIFSNAFLSDIAAMRHETLQPRLFQS